MEVALKHQIDPFTGEIKTIMNDDGHEVPDSTPVAIPSHFKRPETLQEQIRRLVRSEQFNQEREAAGEETFDEADDFMVDDDFDPSTPYEVFFDPVLDREVSPAEFEKNAEGYRKRYVNAMKQMYEKVDYENVMAENLYRYSKKSGGEGGRPPSESNQKAPGEVQIPKPGGESP